MDEISKINFYILIINEMVLVICGKLLPEILSFLRYLKKKVAVTILLIKEL